MNLIPMTFAYRDKNYVMERSAISIKSADMSRTPSMPLVSKLSIFVSQHENLMTMFCHGTGISGLMKDLM